MYGMNNFRAWLHSLLRRTEPYVKTDMVYLFHGNFWLNINRALGILNGLVLSIAFANLLTKEAYGMYVFALAFIGVFSSPQTTALGAGVLKGVTKEDNSIVDEGLRIIFPWSLAGSAALVVSAIYYAVMHNYSLSIIFFIAGIVLPISVSNGIAKSFFTLKGEFGILARFNAVRTPLITAILIGTAWITHSSFIVIICHIVGNVILGALLYRIMRKKYDFTIPAAPRRENFAKKYAFHCGILSIFGYLSEKIDGLVLWKFLGAEPLAIYAYASIPVRELRSFIENQGTLAIPKYAKKEFADVYTSVKYRMGQMYFIAVPLIILYVLSAPYIFELLFPQYVQAVPFSQLIALSILVAPRRLMNAAISSHQKIKESYIMVVLPSTIRIISAVILIPIFGITGAVIALLFSEIIDYAVLGILMNMSAKSI
jgi:polysaccharide transporter, PST family